MDSNNPPSEDDYSLMILKNRLAKGEITVEEFNSLKQILAEKTLENKPIENNKKGSLQPKKQKKRIGKKIALGIVVGIGLWILLGMMIVPTDYKTAIQNTKYKMGDYVWFNGINYQVVDFGFAGRQSIYDKPNGQYLKVYLEMMNLQNDPSDVRATDFFLIDGNGNRYSEATEYAYDSLLVTTLQPKIPTRSYVVFDIPINTNSSNYYLEINDQNHLVKLSR